MRIVAFARRLGVAAGLMSSLVAVLLGLVTLGASPSMASAQTLTGNCWETAVAPGVGECYSTPQEACKRQFDVYAYTHIGPFEPISSSGVWGTRLCHWVWHIGDSGAATVSYICPDGQPIFRGVCSGLDWVPPQPCVPCQNGGGTPKSSTPYPIDILSGNKSFQVDDFSTADGSLRLHRIYTSSAYLGAPAELVDMPLGLANWMFDFQYELHLGQSWSGANTVTVATPDGQVLAFLRGASGALTPVAGSRYALPQTDYTLAFVGSWPASLSTLTSASSQWTLTDADDTTWTLQTFLDPVTGLYDIARPVTMIRRDGVQWTFDYATPYQLLSITDSFGKQITFDWIVNDARSAGGFASVRAISAVHLPGGYTIKYNYESVGTYPTGFVEPDRLSQVQYLDASDVIQDQVTYQYGNASFPTALTGILDRNGVQRWTVTYDSQGRATSSSGPSGADNFSVAYGTMSNGPSTFTRTVTNPLGKVFTYTYARSSSNQITLTSVNSAATTNTPATTSSYAYGTDHLVSSYTDEKGNVVTYTRDPRGMAEQTVEASGTASARTSTTTWDTTRHLPTQVVAPGVTTNYVYDTTAGGGAASGAAQTTKRYWRVRVTNSNGAMTGANYHTEIGDLQLFETAGGGDLARTAINWSTPWDNTYPGFVPANALDGQITTKAGLLNGASGPPYSNTYMVFDFGAGVSQAIHAVAITAPTGSTAAAPSDFTVEWSPDGNNWTTGWTVSGQSGWTAGETRLFVDPSYSYTGSFWGSHTYWRAELGIQASGQYSVAELQFHATPGATDEIGSAAASSSQNSQANTAAIYAHDGNVSTSWRSLSGTSGQWIQYQFSSAVPLAEVQWTAPNNSWYVESPLSGSMAYSDDGTTWHEAFPLLHPSAWTSGETYTFTDPYYH